MKSNRFYSLLLIYVVFAFLLSAGAVAAQEGRKIVHDAEYYILKAQNSEKWAAEDKQIDQKLAALKEKNGGKPPNIVYLLWDDTAFGAVGLDKVIFVRGI